VTQLEFHRHFGDGISVLAGGRRLDVVTDLEIYFELRVAVPVDVALKESEGFFPAKVLAGNDFH